MRKKKTKKKFLIPLVIGIIILLLGVLYFTGIIPQTTFGSSTLGLQEVKYFTSSSECFDSSREPLWLYTFRGGGLGQWATGMVTPDDAASLNSGNENPENNFRMDTKYEQYCVYPIVRDITVTPIYKFTKPQTWTCLTWDEDTFNKDKAYEKCGSSWVGGKYGNSLKCWCSSEQKMTGGMGNTPNFNYPSTKTVMEVGVTSKGTTYAQTFTSDNQIRGKVGDNVCIVWQGNMVTGSVCGLPSQTVIPGYINGEWKLLSKEYYNTYRSAYDSFISTAKSGSGTETKINDLIDELNSKADKTLNSRIGFGTIEEPTSQTNAKIVKKLDNLIQYPVLTAYIRASWIGVVTPIPIPKIKSATSNCFSSGDTGTINVMVENIGNERGEIDVYGTCDSGFNVERKSISIASKESKMVVLQITGTTSQNQLKGSCTITADAIEHKDTKKVTVCVNGLPSCTVGEVVCIDNKIYECLDGIKRTLKEDCASKNQVCSYDSKGKPFCAEEDFCKLHPEDPKCKGVCGAWLKIGGKTIIPDLFCLLNNFFNKFKIVFSIFVGLLGGLLSASYLNKFMDKKKLKYKNWLLVVLGIAFAVGLGFLAYYYFWTILIILIALGIIKFFIP